MSLADRVAYLVVQRPKTLIAVTLLVIGLSFWILSAHQRFDSEVLNLLPKGSPEVQGLKIFNADFRQGRELIFALKGDPNVVADFEDEFVEGLRKEPWVQRVFAGSPMESPDEIAALQTLVPQLLLNLPDEHFSEAVTALSPAALTERVRRLKAEIEAGSPKADMETNLDPLGLVTKAMRPMAGVYGMEKGQSLSSADGTLHLIPVVTIQESLGQAECRATMAQVEDFKRRILAASPGPKPEILVTGRTPYVAQIASSMELDVSVTSSISFVVVTVLFFVGFRRLMPPIGTTIVLALSCFVAFAIGCLLFENLNMVAISFCSILAGLGDDFSLLLYNRYLLARIAPRGSPARRRHVDSRGGEGDSLRFVHHRRGLPRAAVQRLQRLCATRHAHRGRHRLLRGDGHRAVLPLHPREARASRARGPAASHVRGAGRLAAAPPARPLAARRRAGGRFAHLRGAAVAAAGVRYQSAFARAEVHPGGDRAAAHQRADSRRRRADHLARRRGRRGDAAPALGAARSPPAGARRPRGFGKLLQPGRPHAIAGADGEAPGDPARAGEPRRKPARLRGGAPGGGLQGGVIRGARSRCSISSRARSTPRPRTSISRARCRRLPRGGSCSIAISPRARCSPPRTSSRWWPSRRSTKRWRWKRSSGRAVFR